MTDFSSESWLYLTFHHVALSLRAGRYLLASRLAQGHSWRFSGGICCRWWFERE